jgi:recombination protein RecR
MTQNPIDHLIGALSKLPGFGKRSARRSVLHLVTHKEDVMLPLIEALQNAVNTISVCESCGNVDTQNPCHICTNEKRSQEQLCIVEEVSDLWALERSNTYHGQYCVLGGTLSAIEGRNPSDLNIEMAIERVRIGAVKEVILATNATVEGQTTAHYITERLKEFDVTVSRIAHGIPIGGELDYLDEGTLGTALQARRPF